MRYPTLLPTTRRSSNFSTARLLIVAIHFAALPATAIAAKTDVVVFENGDRLTGEVKGMERGRLKFKTDAAGTIQIEWDKIARLSSTQNIQVETVSGARYFGRLLSSEDEFRTVVATEDGPSQLTNERIVRMNPIDQQGLRDIDLSVSAGYNYTKASNVTQFNVGLDARYRTRQRVSSIAFSSIVSDSANNEASQRQTFNYTYTRLRANRWLNDGILSLERNDELGLNLRTSIGAGIGRILHQSNKAQFNLNGGLKATRENLVGQQEDKDSLESYVSALWDWFRYDSPELDWSTKLEVIPSLTESGRVRTDFDTTLKWEIIGDLFWRLEFYQSYDNQPQSEAGASSDYGIITSVSYDF